MVHPDYKPAEATLRPDGTVFLKPDYVTEGELVTALTRHLTPLLYLPIVCFVKIFYSLITA